MKNHTKQITECIAILLFACCYFPSIGLFLKIKKPIVRMLTKIMNSPVMLMFFVTMILIVFTMLLLLPGSGCTYGLLVLMKKMGINISIDKIIFDIIILAYALAIGGVFVAFLVMWFVMKQYPYLRESIGSEFAKNKKDFIILKKNPADILHDLECRALKKAKAKIEAGMDALKAEAEAKIEAKIQARIEEERQKVQDNNLIERFQNGPPTTWGTATVPSGTTITTNATETSETSNTTVPPSSSSSSNITNTTIPPSTLGTNVPTGISDGVTVPDNVDIPTGTPPGVSIPDGLLNSGAIPTAANMHTIVASTVDQTVDQVVANRLPPVPERIKDAIRKCDEPKKPTVQPTATAQPADGYIAFILTMQGFIAMNFYTLYHFIR